MREKDYWTRLRTVRLTRRTMLRASARVGVGATGLALVGCGDDDDAAPAAAAATQTQADEEQAAEQQAEQVAEQAGAEEQAQAQAEEQAEEEQAAEQAQAVAQVNLDAEVRFAIAGDAGGTDYMRSGSHLNYIVNGSVFTTPMFFDNVSSKLTVNTASFEVVDPTNYIIHALDGIKWHDGSAHTADDIMFSFERMGELAAYHDGGESTDHPSGVWTSSRTHWGANNFESYELPDMMNLRVKVEKPNGTFPGNFLAAPHTMSRAYVERVGDAENDKTPMGSGPWKFVSHSDDTDFIFTRNDEYHWGYPDGRNTAATHLPWSKDLTVVVRPEQLSQIAGLEAGELDAVPKLSVDLVKPFLDHSEIQVVYQNASNPTHQIMPNTHNPELPDGSPNPFLDIRVRQAANMAVNRESIISNVLTGTELPSFGPGPTHIGYDIPQSAKDEMYFGYQPEKAKELLAAAGYPDGFDITLHIVTDYQPIVGILALIVQQDLSAIGIRTTIKEYLKATYFSDDGVRARPGEAGLWWFFTCACPDPQSYMGAEIEPGAFYSMSEYPDSKIPELYYAQQETMDPDDRAEAIRQLNIEHYKEAAWIYLTEVKDGVLLAPGVEWDTHTSGIRGEGNLSLLKKFV